MPRPKSKADAASSSFRGFFSGPGIRKNSGNLVLFSSAAAGYALYLVIIAVATKYLAERVVLSRTLEAASLDLSPPATSPAKWYTNSGPFKQPQVAICLSGGLRILELTAWGLQKHLFPAYAPADVFVFAPLDETSHKVLLLAEAQEAASGGSWRIRTLRFNIDAPLDDETPAASKLDPIFSGTGVLLQTFEIIEGCFRLIQDAEEEQGSLYSWILRVRPDSFFIRRPPPLAQYKPNGFTSPAGYEWGGLNDRFAITPRHLGDSSLLRLEMFQRAVRDINLRDYPFNRSGGHVNGEQCLRAQLEVEKVSMAFEDFSFCILSKHQFPGKWPLKKGQPPVFSISSTAPLNGAYCRPCVPDLSGEQALEVLRPLEEGWNRPFHELKQKDGWDMCNATAGWPEGWEDLFDKNAGNGARDVRLMFKNMDGEEECEERLTSVISAAVKYIGPPAHVLCGIRKWGTLFGSLKAGRVLSNDQVLELAGQARGLNPSILYLPTFPSFNRWKHESHGMNFSFKACQLLVQLNGTKPYLYVKADIVKKFQENGWLLLKCGGRLLQQVCLLVNPPLCKTKFD